MICVAAGALWTFVFQHASISCWSHSSLGLPHLQPYWLKQGVALTGRNRTGPPRAAPGELHCICACYRRRQTPEKSLVWSPYSMCRRASNNVVQLSINDITYFRILWCTFSFDRCVLLVLLLYVAVLMFATLPTTVCIIIYDIIQCHTCSDNNKYICTAQNEIVHRCAANRRMWTIFSVYMHMLTLTAELHTGLFHSFVGTVNYNQLNSWRLIMIFMAGFSTAN